MTRLRNILIAAAVVACPTVVFAAPYGSYGYDPGFPWLGLLIGWMMFMIGLMLAIVVGFFVFWVMMLVDCVQRDFPDRALWLIILIVSVPFGLHWLTGLLYYLLVKRPAERR
ncbi:MAG: PLDc N-terminal domain-containing protein [Patescibacteria group bacterium]|nr:PLDc N-terminal domain-containing protein [Patescibacteria group bacterium]